MANRMEKFIYILGFLDNLSLAIFLPLFPKYARQVGISPMNIGLYGSIYGFLQFFSSPIIGGWADQYGKVSWLKKCLLLSSISYFILGSTDTMWLILLSRVIAGCFKHTQSLSKALLADISETNKHHEVFGFQTSISNLGFIVGPTLGGLISELENGFHKATLLGANLIILQSLFVLIFMKDEYSTDTTSKIGDNKCDKKKDIMETLKEIFRKPGLREIFIIQFLISSSSLLFRENASLLLHERYNTSTRNIGFMISFANFVSSISGFFVGKLATLYDNDDSRLLLHCTVVHVIAVLSSTFAPEFWIYIMFLVPYKLAQSVGRVAIMSLMMENADGVASGELMGTCQGIFAISRIFGPFVCGTLQEISVLVPGALSGVLGILMIPSILRSRVKPKQS